MLIAHGTVKLASELRKYHMEARIEVSDLLYALFTTIEYSCANILKQKLHTQFIDLFLQCHLGRWDLEAASSPSYHH